MTADSPHDLADLDDLPTRRLIAGAVGPERRPLRRDPDEPRWFEPQHVRAPGVSRAALARSVEAGADVLVAPTWLTHRRALLPVGETRRAGDWTAAAVRIAREAVDAGMEGRARRSPVLVAGVLPYLGEESEGEAGRLAPRDAAAERDLRAAAGLLAENRVDLLLVEGGPTVAGARAAVEVSVETGLETWVSVPVQGTPEPGLVGGEALEAWAASTVQAGAAGLLIAPADGTDVATALRRLRAAGVAAERTGVLAVAPSEAGLRAAALRWLEAGAWHVGLGDDATPRRLAVLRAAIDEVDGARIAHRAAARDRWVALIGEAARRAPGGRAAWIGPLGPGLTLPAGFAWSVVPVEMAAALPAGELRLLVAAAPLPGERIAMLLEPGGVALVRGAGPAPLASAGLRPMEMPESSPAIIVRRDH